MKQIAKLKDEARKHEQREEWDRAIQAYVQVLELGESNDTELDLPLYNRVGDLYVRLGRAAEAVKYYEQAADKYAEAGLFNNAIALCNKALRYDAGRVELLKKLGQFSASQGFFTDARRWYLEYCERMSKRGAMDEAFQALSELADVHDDPEIRELLARQLKDHGRPDQALREYQRAYALRESRGDSAEADILRAEILALDPNADLAAGADVATTPGQFVSAYDELPGFDEPIVRRYDAPGFEEPEAVVPAEAAPIEIGPTELAFDGPVEESTLDTETLQIESNALGFGEETPAVEYDASMEFGTIDLETSMVSQEPADSFTPLDVGIETSAEFAPPPTEESIDEALVSGFEEEVDQAEELMDLPAFDLDTPVTYSEEFDAEAETEPPLPILEEETFAQQLVEEEPPEDELGGPLPLSFEYADEAVGGVEEEVWPSTEDAGDEAFAVDFPIAFPPPPLPAFELEVPDAADAEVAEPEIAEPDVDEPTVVEYDVEAYEDVFEEAAPQVEEGAQPEFAADAELETELDLVAEAPEAEAPPEAYAAEPEPEVAPPPPPAAPPSAAPARPQPEYVDLSSFLLDDEAPVETTRFVVTEHAPTGDEERDFADMLKQFKAKVAETIPKEDAGSHYDLGLAFKEMGLIDEAIAEFQTALRGGQEKLKVYEELGGCFVQKQQYSVAVTILTRAMQMPHNDDSELLGVYYNLGRAHEELGQFAEARAAYERIISVDIGFQDTSQRLAKL